VLLFSIHPSPTSPVLFPHEGLALFFVPRIHIETNKTSLRVEVGGEGSEGGGGKGKTCRFLFFPTLRSPPARFLTSVVSSTCLSYIDALCLPRYLFGCVSVIICWVYTTSAAILLHRQCHCLLRLEFQPACPPGRMYTQETCELEPANK
jgi:hypothetical protein